jgi:flagellar biosynthesis/type III secretory pathway M-ring protein FliF/YscJ
MVLLLRVFLIGLIVYLLVRPLIIVYRRGVNEQDRADHRAAKDKKISKDTGEYIEYEEIKD